jgi:hypothetical protein
VKFAAPSGIASDGAAGSGNWFGRRVQGFDVSNNVFSSEASDEEDRLVFRLSNQQPSPRNDQRIAGGIGVAILLMTAGIAAAQNPTPAAPIPPGVG